jgi:hypothetical protein
MAVDELVAVDSTGAPIHLGDFVDLYFCKVVGFRADANNRLNVLVVPALNKIITVDASNPLTGQVDEKAILVSGYHCVAYAAIGNGASRSAGITTAQTTATADAAITPTPLPSNFLTPSQS